MASDENRKKPAPENVAGNPASTVSEHKTSHQQNPKKSSRPARRKATSTFQPGVHGRLILSICGDGKGNVDEGISSLFASLGNRFDCSDVVNALLIELAVTDYWRQSRTLQYERQCFRRDVGGFCPQGDMPVLTRYLTASRRSLDKSLQMLLQIEKDAQEATASEAETEAAETSASTADAASQSRPSTTEAKADEAELQGVSATSENEASTIEPATTMVQGGEGESSCQDNVPAEQASTTVPVPPVAETGAEPAGDAVETPAETPAAELPKAA